MTSSSPQTTKHPTVADRLGTDPSKLHTDAERALSPRRRESQTTERIFTVYDTNCYWSMPDGSNRCITQEDSELINEALRRPIGCAEKNGRLQP